MKRIVIQVEDNIYDKVIFLLESLKDKGLEIEEESQSQKIMELFKNKNVKPFEDIKNPVEWQRKIREEWE